MDIIHHEIEKRKSLNSTYLNYKFDFDNLPPDIAYSYLAEDERLDYIKSFIFYIGGSISDSEINEEFRRADLYTNEDLIAKAAFYGNITAIRYLSQNSNFELEDVIDNIYDGIEHGMFNFDSLDEILDFIVDNYPNHNFDIRVSPQYYKIGLAILDHPRATIVNEESRPEIRDILNRYRERMEESIMIIEDGRFDEFRFRIRPGLNLIHLNNVDADYVRGLSSIYHDARDMLLLALFEADISRDAMRALQGRRYTGDYHYNIHKYEGIIRYPEWFDYYNLRDLKYRLRTRFDYRNEDKFKSIILNLVYDKGIFENLAKYGRELVVKPEFQM